MANNRDQIAGQIMAAMLREDFRNPETMPLDLRVLAGIAVRATDELLKELRSTNQPPPLRVWTKEHGEDGAMFYASKTDRYKLALIKNNERGGAKGKQWDLYLEDIHRTHDKIFVVPIVGNTKEAQEEASIVAIQLRGK